METCKNFLPHYIKMEEWNDKTWNLSVRHIVKDVNWKYK